MLGRLQHQGGPISLLDWTYDLMVALYFACREKDCKNGRVWFKLIPHPRQTGLERMASENVLSVLSSTAATESKSHFLFEPNRTDPRTQAQSSVFLLLDTGRIDWQKEDLVLGFVIPKEHKEPPRKYLCWAHNVENRILFADLPGTVDWLKSRSPREFDFVLGQRMMD